MRTKYLLPCPCGKKIAIEVAQAGQTVRCACGAKLEIPAMRRITSLEPLGPEAEDRRSRSIAAWDKHKARMLLGAVLTVVAGMLIAWLAWSRPRLSNVQTLSLLESWTLWRELRLGANRDPSLAAKEFAKSLMANRDWTVVAVSLTILGLLIMVGLFVTRNSSAGHTARKRHPVEVVPGRVRDAPSSTKRISN